MKKILSVIMILCICGACMLGMSACDSNGKDNNSTTTAAPETTNTPEAVTTPAQDGQQAADNTFTFTFKGTDINMKADAAPILEAMGECKSYTEETSCAFDGLDKNYTYTSFVLTTYPDGETDRINSVTLYDDTVGTAAGICIGDSQEKVEAAYGADSFNGVNAYIIKDASGDSQLTVILQSGKVSSIQYAALFD